MWLVLVPLVVLVLVLLVLLVLLVMPVVVPVVLVQVVVELRNTVRRVVPIPGELGLQVAEERPFG